MNSLPPALAMTAPRSDPLNRPRSAPGDVEPEVAWSPTKGKAGWDFTGFAAFLRAHDPAWVLSTRERNDRSVMTTTAIRDPSAARTRRPT
jgi:hypothetical protein